MTGTTISHYRIVEKLGAGGMGLVYRAHDLVLRRPVALKFLAPDIAGDHERRARFQREARLAAVLNHPNTCTVYEVGQVDAVDGISVGDEEGRIPCGTPFIAMELVEGVTLATRLAHSGRLPAREVLDLALQAAAGLGEAHRHGIVHRDLKPQNIMVTPAGRVKILDFGLAKPFRAVQPADVWGSTPEMMSTDLGEARNVIGTVAYMAPEQARGHATDPRSDVFAFGVTLYELLTGQRPFRGGTVTAVIVKILTAEPAPLPSWSTDVPPPFMQIVHRCLQKRPEDRYEDARDLLSDLDQLRRHATASASLDAPSSPERELTTLDAVVQRLLKKKRRGGQAPLVEAAFAPGAGGVTEAPDSQRSAGGAPAWRRLRMSARDSLIAAIVLALGTAAYWWRGGAAAPRPTFQQLTFQRGYVTAALFAPDGDDIVYGARWDGGPLALYSTRAAAPDSRRIDAPDAIPIAAGPDGQLTVALQPHFEEGIYVSTLARLPVTGSAPRELVAGVNSADCLPGGLCAVSRHVKGTARLEFPPGTLRHEQPGFISDLRFSPDGARLAFMSHPILGDNRGTVSVHDLGTGRTTTLTNEMASETGVAWTPDGREVWFTAAEAGRSSAFSLFGVTLNRQVRVVERMAGGVVLYDVARDGRVLLGRITRRTSALALRPDERGERDLSWLETSLVADLSRDGKFLLFAEEGPAAGPAHVMCLRATAGAAPIRLGPGAPLAISPDGQWVLGALSAAPPALALVPAGAGESRLLDLGPIEYKNWASWLPDGQHVVFSGTEPGHGSRLYVIPIAGGTAQPFTPEGVSVRTSSRSVSPDGRFVVAQTADGRSALYPLDGTPPTVLSGLGRDAVVARWTADGRALFVYPAGAADRLPIDRYDVATGRRTPWRTIAPADPAGITWLGGAQVSADESTIAYSAIRILTDLYLVKGLR